MGKMKELITDDQDYCEYCQNAEIDHNDWIETSFLDADGDRKTMWLCQQCYEEEEYLR